MKEKEKAGSGPVLVGLLRVCARLCPALCDPLDSGLPGAFIHWIFQARMLVWAAVLSSKDSFWPRDRTFIISCFAGGFFTPWAIRETCWSPKSSQIVQKGELGKVCSAVVRNDTFQMVIWTENTFLFNVISSLKELSDEIFNMLIFYDLWVTITVLLCVFPNFFSNKFVHSSV